MNKEVFWCSTCLNMSTRNRIEFDEQGRCNACVWSEEKKTLDWGVREKELLQLFNKHSRPQGQYDIIVPVSGGKDGSYVSHMCRSKYGLNPLCVTINPPLRSGLGYQNLENFKKAGFPLIEINPPYEIMRKLNKRGFVEQGRPLYGWTTAIFTSVIRIAKAFNISLIMYGEDGEIEYGGSNESKYKPTFTAEFVRRVYLEGRVGDTFRDLGPNDLFFWDFGQGEHSGIELAHWSYFENWDPYRNYLVAKEFCGLGEKEQSNTGTYTNFAQNDNVLYDLHTYLMYLKFGFGRSTQDVGIDIRRGALSREQGSQLAQMYDNHFPEEYLQDYLNYYQMKEDEFFAVLDNFANKFLFKKVGKLWEPTFEIK
ncbi:MAG: N-acetyl sugar amidotransferase [Bdellovibrio sp.]